MASECIMSVAMVLMLADYLSFSGWSRIEVLQSWVPGTALNPLWVVRGVNAG